TGVQTCALPISRSGPAGGWSRCGVCDSSLRLGSALSGADKGLGMSRGRQSMIPVAVAVSRERFAPLMVQLRPGAAGNQYLGVMGTFQDRNRKTRTRHP